jgi:hypothetical protein
VLPTLRRRFGIFAERNLFSNLFVRRKARAIREKRSRDGDLEFDGGH